MPQWRRKCRAKEHQRFASQNEKLRSFLFVIASWTLVIGTTSPDWWDYSFSSWLEQGRLTKADDWLWYAPKHQHESEIRMPRGKFYSISISSTLNVDIFRRYQRRLPSKVMERSVCNPVRTDSHHKGEWQVSELDVTCAVKEFTSVKTLRISRYFGHKNRQN